MTSIRKSESVHGEENSSVQVLQEWNPVEIFFFFSFLFSLKIVTGNSKGFRDSLKTALWLELLKELQS